MRTGMLLLGLALGILWIVGMSEHATTWLVWTDFAVAVLSVLAAVVPLGETGESSSSAIFRVPPLVLCSALLVLWIIALAIGATPFMAWWTLAFAVAYGVLGALSTPATRIATPPFPGSPIRP